VGKPFNVSLQEGLGAPLRLWSFEEPHLYNLDVTLPPENSQVHSACLISAMSPLTLHNAPALSSHLQCIAEHAVGVVCREGML
jgi:hypothetical protein